MLNVPGNTRASDILDYFSPTSKQVPGCSAAAAAKSRQSCLTLCDLIDGSPPGSPVPGILQARTLEWVAISFSNAWKWKVKVKSLSRVRLLATPWTVAYQALPSIGFSRQEYWSGLPLPSPQVVLDNVKCTNRASLVAQTLKICLQCSRRCVRAKLLQLCLILCDPVNCNPPGSSVHGILQGRTLEWFAIPPLQGIFQTQGLNWSLLHLMHWQTGSFPLETGSSSIWEAVDIKQSFVETSKYTKVLD